MELDVEAMGLTIPERGFLIVQDSAHSSSVPGLIGMNVVKTEVLIIGLEAQGVKLLPKLQTLSSIQIQPIM